MMCIPITTCITFKGFLILDNREKREKDLYVLDEKYIRENKYDCNMISFLGIYFHLDKCRFSAWDYHLSLLPE